MAASRQIMVNLRIIGYCIKTMNLSLANISVKPLAINHISRFSQKGVLPKLRQADSCPPEFEFSPPGGESGQPDGGIQVVEVTAQFFGAAMRSVEIEILRLIYDI
jgi:hypothetical protein